MEEGDGIRFQSPEEEIYYWKNLAVEYKQSLEEARDELDEFQLGSRELEAELEAQLEQQEAKNRELMSKNSHLNMDKEILQEKLESLQATYHKQSSELEDELATVKSFKEELQKYIRELEQSNDDLERSKRSTVTSLEDFESRLNHAIERNAFLESELEERESLQITVQRLKDEARDMREELAVKQERPLLKAHSLDRTPDNSSTGSPVTTSAATTPSTDSNRLADTTITETITPMQTPSKGHLSQGGTPLTPSARISALNIVGDLLRKVGALESKLATCRNFAKEQPRNNRNSSPMNSPRFKNAEREVKHKKFFGRKF